MPVTVVLGSQWGDEGKGKLVDILASSNCELCCRFQGGNNAGHTIVVGDVTYDFHLLPSGFINPQCVNVIGNGLVVHLPSLFQELDKLTEKGLGGISSLEKRLRVSDRAHLVFDFHQIVDGLKEVELGLGSIGTTKKGIGPCYTQKASRSGLRVHQLMEALEQTRRTGVKWEDTDFIQRFKVIVENRKKRYGQFDYDVEKEVQRYLEYAKRLEPFVCDLVPFLNNILVNHKEKHVLIEGANAAMLDIDFGTYPFVTSSNCTVGGVCTGLGIPPQHITKVIGVVKAYTTRVGAGVFPTEQLNDVGEKLQKIGGEIGVTTGRKRRCGWLDVVVLRYSTMINGYTSLNLTKLDVLDSFDEIKIGVAYVLNGKRIETFPASLKSLENAEVVYETMPGWMKSIKDVRKWDDLPENAKKYVVRVQELVGVKVEWIGVGAKRDAMIKIQ
ncbi:hypothetical protein MP638_003470 [Amoeboaphelidium occidentale]|nr:hypothetical protein MP638_003470 [Amoeboaphelidium occidentale]